MPIIIPSPRNDKVPVIHEKAFVAPTATVIGDVIIEEGANIWFGAVLRGDWGHIKIGKKTSVQENVTIHNQVGSSAIIGDNCIIGHHAMIHGPTEIGNGCLIGIGANILQNTKLGEGVLVGAGAVVVNQEIPERTLAVGVPAKVKKKLPSKGTLIGARTTGEYAENGRIFKEFFEKNEL